MMDNEAVAIYYGKIGCKLSDLEGVVCDTFRSSTCRVTIICLLPTVAFTTQGSYELITNGYE
jgi:hypothetical protein